MQENLNNENNTSKNENEQSLNNSISSEKTRLVDISEISSTRTTGSIKASTTGIGKRRAKIAAKVTAKSSLFMLRKVLTYALNIFLTALLVGIITGAVVGVAFLIYVKNYIDPEYNGLDNLKFDSAGNTKIYYLDKEGKEVEIDTLSGSENRLWAEYTMFPENLKDAYVSVEDQRFWEHNGVDIKRTLSAVYNFFIPTKSSYGGGSTITQQLIKNVTGENETTIQRKVQEIFRSLNVNEKFSRQEILEMYLNTIYLSQNSYGVRVAAQTYFGKELQDLTLVECASLAAIAKSPIAYDPILNPKNNLQRRNLVLKLMLEQGKITQEEYNESYDAPLVLNRNTETDYTETIHSYYIDTVIDDALNFLMKEKDIDITTASRILYSGKLKIITCIDPVVQNELEKVFTNDSIFDDKTMSESENAKGQAAMCIVDPHTGNLLGIVGGRGEKKINRGFNRATQSKRQCGSSIKPLSIYALAIDTGLYTYGSSVDDVPTVYFADKNTYWPTNANKRFAGKIPLTRAINESLNTVAVQTVQKLGIDTVFDNLLKQGFTTLVDSKTLDNGVTYSDKQLSPLALGSFTDGVTVREMTQAYTSFANQGILTKARTFTEIIDDTDTFKNEIEQEQIYSESTAYIMTSLLENVIKDGTAKSVITLDANFKDLEVAGKTGSTNENKDNYFCGYTPDYVGCTWFGYDNNKTITSRRNPATKLWDLVMNNIYTYLKENNIEYTKEFYMPPSIVTGVTYCSCSGDMPTEACGKDLYHTHYSGPHVVYNDGVYAKGTLPSKPCDVHVEVDWDPDTKAVCFEGFNCTNKIRVSLRKITSREYNQQIRILDAQFVYWDLPEGYIYPTGNNVPFFQNLIGSGIYVGSSGVDHPANRVCIEHYDPSLYPDVSDDMDISFYD
ncbi:MAG: hypothetical protein A2Y15_06405 [Clostridiales bacterium GWF2_36_10]|nr:MAG: hypothetical protein A2Y15_06405 [Clostridiales bacterium GWF2_36_10]HAN21854.1 hypothetical protein [Clostridiales bacterium]